ncbi:MAG: hypothetical protein VB086_04215 [Clostridiaceae bacterium]|nr:hypothetical protein [Clostridiaceae bacterium]
MNYSNLTLDLFDRIQGGKENYFAICWQRGIPGMVRCGNIAGEIVMATVSLSASNGSHSVLTEATQPGKDNTYIFVGRKNNQALYSLLVDGIETLSSESITIGSLSVVAKQNSEKCFAIIAFWAPSNDGSNSFLLAGSDDNFVSFAASCSGFIRTALL